MLRRENDNLRQQVSLGSRSVTPLGGVPGAGGGRMSVTPGQGQDGQGRPPSGMEGGPGGSRGRGRVKVRAHTRPPFQLNVTTFRGIVSDKKTAQVELKSGRGQAPGSRCRRCSSTVRALAAVAAAAGAAVGVGMRRRRVPGRGGGWGRSHWGRRSGRRRAGGASSARRRS